MTRAQSLIIVALVALLALQLLLRHERPAQQTAAPHETALVDDALLIDLAAPAGSQSNPPALGHSQPPITAATNLSTTRLTARPSAQLAASRDPVSHASVPSAPPVRRSPFPPRDGVDAEVVEEVTEGTAAELGSRTPGDEEKAIHLNKLVKERKAEASLELVRLFQTERDPAHKANILSAGSLVDYDFHSRSLLMMALSPGEDQEVRFQAIAQAAERDPDLLSRYRDDPDPEVRDEIESAFAGEQKPDESRVLRGPLPKPPRTSPPPARRSNN